MGNHAVERFSGADSAWWHMEAPENQMVITGVLTFDRPFGYDELCHLLRERLLPYRRFRQRAVDAPLGIGRGRWEDDPHFSLEHHLERRSLPAPASRAELQALVSEEMSRPLELDRPLWRFTWVERYEGGSALVARIHHCMADGIALIRLLLTLDDLPGNESSVAATWAAANSLRSRAVGWRRVAAIAAASLGTALKLLLMPIDRPSALRRPLGREKRASWAEPIPLEELRRTAEALGGTLNDLLASALAGALRRHLLARGDGPVPDRMRAVVPVNLRPPSLNGKLGNEFGVVFLPLPTGTADPLERLREVSREMDRLKRSPQAYVVYWLLQIFGRTPRWMERLIVILLGLKASLVMTNVPGPREPVQFLGRKVRVLMAWVPQAGKLSLGVSVLSYNGEVQLGVASDAGVEPDPEALLRAYQEALAELAALAETAGAGVRA